MDLYRDFWIWVVCLLCRLYTMLKVRLQSDIEATSYDIGLLSTVVVNKWSILFFPKKFQGKSRLFLAYVGQNFHGCWHDQRPLAKCWLIEEFNCLCHWVLSTIKTSVLSPIFKTLHLGGSASQIFLLRFEYSKEV